MPRKLTTDSLKAEESGLKALLADAEKYGDIVGQIQYKQRLEEISKDIESLESNPNPFASVALYFSGRPVIGSRGIAAEFASKALGNYQDLISKTFAKSELGAIGERGKVPLKQSTELMVTGLTHGSFGFVLDELSNQDELHDTALKEVVSTVTELLYRVSSSNEEDFERAAEELDSRTLITLREFFKDLDSSEATIRIVEDNTDITLDDRSIHRGRVRTEATQIEDSLERIEGVLTGFLPEHRKFEIKISSGETIYGTASKEATEHFMKIVAHGNPVLGRSCRASIYIKHVKSLNREPREIYRLIEFHQLG
ncbi:hypothetical protein KW851_09860 [Pseudomonas sp. PDM33]|uniref:hypothetical protein n=1 Tax=Pseudomonas sp. PDM33 TaxID=2854765 RepID=UPI001C482C1E|nr:hypothetical protein [Pseudomonas sp. PDM33]MBV7583119.1 hypothetical protein [Pseudomonas sp. PDM33]